MNDTFYAPKPPTGTPTFDKSINASVIILLRFKVFNSHFSPFNFFTLVLKTEKY